MKERKNGYFYGFKRGDTIQFQNGDVGVVSGRLCNPVSNVEYWTMQSLHVYGKRSLRKARHIPPDFLVTCVWYTGGPFKTDAAWEALQTYEG